MTEVHFSFRPLPYPSGLIPMLRSGTFQLTEFQSLDDSCLCLLAAQKMVDRFCDRSINEEIIELCFGSGFVSNFLIKNATKAGVQLCSTGFEIDGNSCDISENNIKSLKLNEKVSIIKEDLLRERGFYAAVKAARDKEATMIVVNPPYVPTPEENYSDITVNGGSDGTKFYRDFIFKYLRELGRPRATVLFSSVCNVDWILEEIDSLGYRIVDLCTCVEPFGTYTRRVDAFIYHDVDGNYVSLDRETRRCLDTGTFVQMIIGLVLSTVAGSEDSINTSEVRSYLGTFKESGLVGIKKLGRFLGKTYYLTEYDILLNINRDISQLNHPIFRRRLMKEPGLT